jgi:hypothetical protein
MKMYIGTRESVPELCDPSDKEMCRWASRLGAVGTSWLAAKVEASRFSYQCRQANSPHTGCANYRALLYYVYAQ